MRASFIGFAVVVMAGSLAAGCLGDAASSAAGTDVAVEEIGSRAWESLQGAWVGASGPFQGLVFTSTPENAGHHFFADADTGIRCIRAPCPSSVRVEGRYTAGSRTVTLASPDRASAQTAPFYGAYAYTLQGAHLTLSQSGHVVARLTRAGSYCAAEDDCPEQRLPVRHCAGGHFACEASACQWQCNAVPDCTTLRCAAGYMCQAGPTGATCITRCATVRCAAGTACVADATGARCVATGTTCGTTTCAAGDTCCNPLRGICTPPGGVCIQ